jgi:hypothetical protein
MLFDGFTNLLLDVFAVQFGNDIFNKGRIMNIAVREALKLDDFDCFIFHDVGCLFASLVQHFNQLP